MLFRNEEEWGQFSPDFLVVLAMLGAGRILFNDLIDFDNVEEFFFNNRTRDSLMSLGCSSEVIDIFEQFMILADVYGLYGETKAKFILSELMESCDTLIDLGLRNVDRENR